MDDSWIYNLDQTSAVIVPTRSLANSLTEQIATHYVSLGVTVWEAPNILVWSDYLKCLWQANLAQITRETGTHTLISNQQSSLLWTQVIETSRRQERELTLLNVQQTVKAVQRSWRLMHDWRVSLDAISQDHVADIEQYMVWLSDYQALLTKRGLIDEPLLLASLCQSTQNWPFPTLIWHSFDLITVAQKQLNDLASTQGVILDVIKTTQVKTSDRRYLVYTNSKEELRATLQQARVQIEQNNQHSINIVVPDLQQSHKQVRELAREIFYPAASPLEVQLNHTVYRFSLGESMSEWAAIETAIRLIALLKNRCTVTELSFLLRNQFLRFSRECQNECRLFERWLKRQRIRNIYIDTLPELYQQCLEYLTARQQQPSNIELYDVLRQLAQKRKAVEQQLDERQSQTDFAALRFSEWVTVFDDWLSEWGWQTGVGKAALDSVQYQLQQRWRSLLEEFVSLATVQRQVGLSRACEILQQMARDAVFLPQAGAAPIFISGLFEAIGRPATTCYLTGMDQSYPSVWSGDAFIPNRLLVGAGYPQATAQGNFEQASKVVTSLLSLASETVVSYAKHNPKEREVECHASPLFRVEKFRAANFETADTDVMEFQQTPLESYTDTQGPAWADAGRARGGSKIFENQSNCAFKAFLTHQLGFLRDDEAEFGLDGLDRGNIMHHLLDRVWEQLQTQEQLLAMTPQELQNLLQSLVEEAVNDPTLELNQDKHTLLQHEKPRLVAVLQQWLALEAKRPQGFAVIERETELNSELAGIKFRVIIDRIDITDDGRSLIIDYKTGSVSRSDWTGERIKSPQMPLYALALDKVKRTPVSGIAYGKVQQHKHSFDELCEAGIFRSESGRSKRYAEQYEEQWLEHRAKWPLAFEQLASEFLAGKADVNPIDDTTCRYCELNSVCRISQLKQSTETGGLL